MKRNKSEGRAVIWIVKAKSNFLYHSILSSHFNVLLPFNLDMYLCPRALLISNRARVLSVHSEISVMLSSAMDLKASK
jgi:hypothetical protein